MDQNASAAVGRGHWPFLTTFTGLYISLVCRACEHVAADPRCAYAYSPWHAQGAKAEKGKGKFTEQEVQAMANVD